MSTATEPALDVDSLNARLLRAGVPQRAREVVLRAPSVGRNLASVNGLSPETGDLLARSATVAVLRLLASRTSRYSAAARLASSCSDATARQLDAWVVVLEREADAIESGAA